MDPTRLRYDSNFVFTEEAFRANTLPFNLEELYTDGITILTHQVLNAEFGIENPHVYKAAASDPDTLSFGQACADPHIEEWKKAAQAEVSSLEGMGTWEEVPLTEAKSKVLPGTWVFRRKRRPDGTIKKYKARYCVRGDLQEGEFDTTSPVASWSTIRMVFVFALAMGWQMYTCDFSNAFVQAELKDDVWIQLPPGFKSKSDEPTCLKLKKSLYGLSVAPRLWYEHLVDGLEKDGFVKSPFDPCLLMKDDMIVFLYVDDVGITAPTKKDIDDFVARMTDKGYTLTLDESFTEYLGIKLARDETENTITMTQPGLIKKILETTGLENCNPNSTPASQVPLGSKPYEEPMDEAWNYASVVGMLLYLSTNSRPDIAFAVSQVARFTSNPFGSPNCRQQSPVQP